MHNNPSRMTRSSIELLEIQFYVTDIIKRQNLFNEDEYELILDKLIHDRDYLISLYLNVNKFVNGSITSHELRSSVVEVYNHTQLAPSLDASFHKTTYLPVFDTGTVSSSSHVYFERKAFIKNYKRKIRTNQTLRNLFKPWKWFRKQMFSV